MKYFLSIVLFACVFNISAQKSSMIGTYKLSMKGDSYFYHFTSDSNLLIVHGTDSTNSIYSIDTSKSPMYLNLRMFDKSNTELYLTKGIFEWIGTDKIRFRMSTNFVDRPISFLPKGNMETYILVRQK